MLFPSWPGVPAELPWRLLICLLPFFSTSAAEHRVYSHLLEPREHPDDARRSVKPPDWTTFKNRTQFTTLRGFNIQNDSITGYAEELEKFTGTFELGDVIWPSYPILFAKNLGDLADEIKRRGLYLFDVWGYVPGSGPGGYWQQFRPPAQAFATLESKLGERWLGTDIGEQDGRYIGGYANQMTPASGGRFAQYLNFQRHFEKMGDDLGHKHATLVSLNFGHYFLKEGTYTMIGAETAQALPNNQVYYAFIRGAGKQYGVPWFGNASIFNRWGFKTYGSSGRSDGYEHGPTKGTSLSLMKRLLYSHILYNCMAVGFENGWLEGDKLSPIGRIQQSANRWVQTNGQPGVLQTPVALLLDFYSGWSFPRHLYSGNIYRVWGNLPYDEGDYLTDAVLDMLYPGYQNSSYFHDETGFISPTPYGDIADCLLSDAPLWLLERYPLVVLAGEVQGHREFRDKLEAYMEHGGHLIVTAGNLAHLPGGLAGVTQSSPQTKVVGQGRLSVLPGAFGITQRSLSNLRGEVDQPLPKPYSLAPEMRAALDAAFREQQLFDIGNTNLSFITCRRAPGEYIIGILNNSWRELPFALRSLCGRIEKLQELPLDSSERTAVGYVPEGASTNTLGQDSLESIAGGQVRLFLIRVTESGVEEIPHRRPAARPIGRALPLRSPGSIKQQILSRPTFFQHFDSVVVDWSYLRERERRVLEEEAPWLARQGLRIFVDLSSGLNLFPTLRLVDNSPQDFAHSMGIIEDILDKMGTLNAHDVILSLHRHPENNFSGEQSQASFEKTLRQISSSAAKRNITLHLRLALGKPPWNLTEAERLIAALNAPNLLLAPNTALLPSRDPSRTEANALQKIVGLWLLASARNDPAGQLWDAHAPLHESPAKAGLARWLALAPRAPLVLDALYDDQDIEYLDALVLQESLKDPAAR